jgi:hypothetical protein
MSACDLLTSEMLNDLLRYDEASGIVYWRQRTPVMFAGETSTQRTARCRRWNTRWAGRQAFTHIDGRGYLQGRVLGVRVLAHRVILCMVNGSWPRSTDHKDGVRTNNRLANLRECSIAENNRNKCITQNHPTGVMGVRWRAQQRNWQVSISANGQRFYLGTFERFDDAVAARKAAEIEHRYGPTHGREPCSTASY